MAVRVVITIVATAVLLLILRFVVKDAVARLTMLRARLGGDEFQGARRAETLGAMLFSVIRFVLLFVAVLVILRQVGVSVAPLITGAGVVGLAVAFGTQSLMKDIATGLLVVAEDQIRVGDRIEVAGKIGSVEAISLRLIRLREDGGATSFIPHGQIAFVTNHSYGGPPKRVGEEPK
jgi:small conductance mechanosensitive channel